MCASDYAVFFCTSPVFRMSTHITCSTIFQIVGFSLSIFFLRFGLLDPFRRRQKKTVQFNKSDRNFRKFMMKFENVCILLKCVRVQACVCMCGTHAMRDMRPAVIF